MNADDTDTTNDIEMHRPSEQSYQEHRRRGEHCDACRQAHNAHVRRILGLFTHR